MDIKQAKKDLIEKINKMTDAEFVESTNTPEVPIPTPAPEPDYKAQLEAKDKEIEDLTKKLEEVEEKNLDSLRNNLQLKTAYPQTNIETLDAKTLKVLHKEATRSGIIQDGNELIAKEMKRLKTENDQMKNYQIDQLKIQLINETSYTADLFDKKIKKWEKDGTKFVEGMNELINDLSVANPKLKDAFPDRTFGMPQSVPQTGYKPKVSSKDLLLPVGGKK